MDPMTRSNVAGSAALQGRRIAYVGPLGGDDALLTRMGAQLRAFGSAEDAFAALLDQDFDLVLVHLQLGGGIGGPEFIRLVRNCGHPLKSQVAIIGLANARQLQFADRLRSTGVSAVLSTPIDVAQLNATVAALMGTRPASTFQGAAVTGEMPTFPAWSGTGNSTATPPTRRPLQTPATTTVGRPASQQTQVDPGNQSLNFGAAPVSNPPGGPTLANDRKGLLERLGDKILARLAKNAGPVAVETPAGGLDPLAAAQRRAGGPNANLPFTAPIPPAATTRRDVKPSAPVHVTQEPLPPPAARAQASPLPPKPAAPAPVRTSAAESQVAAAPRRAVTSKPGATPSAAKGPMPGQPQPYVSRIQRRPAATASAPAPAVDAVATQGETVPSYRLTDAEKNRVYERVRKLVTTARRTAESGTVPNATRNPPQTAKRLKVCFLEDSCTSSHAIREMLGEHGHEVDHFSQAEEAYDAFLEKPYDLLLASQIESIGGMDCERLVREIRSAADSGKRSAPIIVLTANPDPANLQLFRRAGANEVIVKPVEGKRLHERVMAAVSIKRAAPPQPRKTLKVCFLEDSCTSSHAIREMLGEIGHEVDHFSSAEEALDALTEHDYDVLLASQIVALGGMDCVGLIETVRRLPDARRRLMPVVAITADSDPANIERFYIAGASDVIVKPIEGGELNKRIGQALAAQPALEAKNDAAPRFNVCFLEDSCTSSHAIREMLGDAGHEVDHFSSPEEALDALTEKRYHLLLASQIVALGGMDCEQLVRSLRASPKSEQRNLPILVITANPEPANVEKFFAAGANDVVIKPVEGKALNERVRDVVQVKATPMPLTPPPILPAPPRNFRVCFLEDSCTSSHAIREMLGEAGHEVDHFSTPEEALDAFLEKDYDVLLASQLPADGGLDTAGLIARVRAAGGARATKAVVLLTTDPSPENQQRFRRGGVNDVVIKPVEGNLSQRLQDVVARVQGVPTSAGTARRTPVVVPEQLKVCFLEDSCTSSHAIREMLGEAGHEVDHFSSAEEALDAFMEKPYDVMLASQIVALGGLDCEGMIRAIRGAAQPQKRQISVVAITANGDGANVENLKRAGADAVIVKPIEGDLGAQLKQIVGKVLGQPPASRPHLRVVANTSSAPPAGPTTAARPAPVKPTAKAAPAPGGATGATPKPAAAAAAASPGPAKAASGSVNPPPTAAPIFDLKPDALPRTAQSAKSPASGGRERRIVLAVAAAGIMAVVFSTWHHFGEATPVDIVSVEQGPIFETINAPGQVVSKKRVELTTAVPGQIVKVAVKEGDLVKKGQVLATLDDRDAMIQIQRADANLDSAKKDVALTERTLDRLVRALQMGAVSRQMAEDAEAAVNAARAKQRVAAEEARAAQLMAERLNVIAPFDGVVTVSYAVDGLWAEPPGPLFQLVDMTQREVELKIPAEQVSRLNSGQVVNLSSEAFPGHQWTEQIVRVAPATSREQGMANTLSVYATLGPDAPPLRFGQQVDAQIRTAGNERATRVPLGAVTVQNGRPAVAVIEEGHLRFKPVATGIESFSHVEIRDGLKPGDKVVLLNKPLEEGAKVEPVELPG